MAFSLDLDLHIFNLRRRSTSPVRSTAAILLTLSETFRHCFHGLFVREIVLCCIWVVGLGGVTFHPRSLWSWPARSDCTALSVGTSSWWGFWRAWLSVMKKSDFFWWAGHGIETYGKVYCKEWLWTKEFRLEFN